MGDDARKGEGTSYSAHRVGRQAKAHPRAYMGLPDWASCVVFLTVLGKVSFKFKKNGKVSFIFFSFPFCIYLLFIYQFYFGFFIFYFFLIFVLIFPFLFLNVLKKKETLS